MSGLRYVKMRRPFRGGNGRGYATLLQKPLASTQTHARSSPAPPLDLVAPLTVFPRVGYEV